VKNQNAIGNAINLLYAPSQNANLFVKIQDANKLPPPSAIVVLVHQELKKFLILFHSLKKLRKTKHVVNVLKVLIIQIKEQIK